MHRVIALMSILSLSCLAAPEADLFVAPNGDDVNPGTLAKPFATLAKARDAVRALDGVLAQALYRPHLDAWERAAEYAALTISTLSR